MATRSWSTVPFYKSRPNTTLLSTLAIMAPQKPPSQLPPTAIGSKQEIKARSGTATFVPKGHTIKIINSYGSQVVAIWAFALHDAPAEEEMQDERQEMDEAELQGEGAVQSSGEEGDRDGKQGGQPPESPAGPKKEPPPTAAEDEGPHEIEPTVQTASPANDDRQKDTSDAPGPKKGWAAYLPSVRNRSKQHAGDPQIIDSGGEKTSSATRKTWASYLPSVPANKGGKNEPKTWASYIPSGHGFSSYIPKDALHAISEIHKRDPNKSVAEQLYDFSKTPAGAAGLSSKAATKRGD
jgi:hypothetical protein